jgi:hypothetical protein
MSIIYCNIAAQLIAYFHSILSSIQIKRICHDTRDQLNRLSYLVHRNQQQAAASFLIQFAFCLIQGQGQAEVDYNEASLSFNGGITTIYHDMDILVTVWPQLPSSTVTTVQ